VKDLSKDGKYKQAVQVKYLVQNMGRQKLYNLILFYLLKIPSHAFG
jgi:hypothetical protein